MKNKLIATEFLMVGSGNIALQHIDAIISYKKNSKVHLLTRSGSANARYLFRNMSWTGMEDTQIWQHGEGRSR